MHRPCSDLAARKGWDFAYANKSEQLMKNTDVGTPVSGNGAKMQLFGNRQSQKSRTPPNNETCITNVKYQQISANRKEAF